MQGEPREGPLERLFRLRPRLQDWYHPLGWRAVTVCLWIAVLIAAVALWVYVAGGTVFVWVHLMSLPLLLAALFFKVPGGIVAGLLGGLALGPFMPLYVPRGLPQDPHHWLVRTVLYVVFGVITGLLFKWLDDQYRALDRTREKLVASLTELQATQMQLIHKARLESVGRLAAGVAHEVKNPLAIIQLGLDLLNLGPAPDPARAETLHDMEEAVQRADRVVRQLLDFSRAEALAPEPTLLNALIDDSLLLVKHELQKKQIAVATSLDPAIPPLWLDPNKMKQVFINLFVNAAQAMEPGGTLSVRSTLARLGEDEHATIARQVDTFRPGDEVVVAVEDDGPGIPEEKLERIFEPFFTTKPPGEGTGLGLPVSRKIIELHGGTIAAQNRPQGGLRFTLYLPTGKDTP
jgi:signal transduction histidine kinase